MIVQVDLPMAFQRTEMSKQCHSLALLLFGWRSHQGTDGDLKFSVARRKDFSKILDWHIIEICWKLSRLGCVWHFGFELELDLG